MKILIIEPYLGGSHKKWIEGLRTHSSHKIEVLGLSARRWKWRMRGGAITLAKDFLKSDLQPDMILASDMLDLTIFQSLTREQTATIPMCVYFHENQFSYPGSPHDSDGKKQREFHYGFINIASSLAADAVFFNSDFHKRNFLKEATNFLNKFDDFGGGEVLDEIENKSSTLHVGLELTENTSLLKKNENPAPVILWNHRWEYDKNPELFFETLYQLKEENIDFQLIVLGEERKPHPQVFASAKVRLADETIHWGYVKSREEYVNLLQHADLLPVTSIQEFFGISVSEAIYYGCFPILPNRLSYPELIPQELHSKVLYETDDDLAQKIAHYINAPPGQNVTQKLSDYIQQYSWSHIIKNYDNAFEKVITAS